MNTVSRATSASYSNKFVSAPLEFGQNVGTIRQAAYAPDSKDDENKWYNDIVNSGILNKVESLQDPTGLDPKDYTPETRQFLYLTMKYFHSLERDGYQNLKLNSANLILRGERLKDYNISEQKLKGLIFKAARLYIISKRSRKLEA